MNRNLYLRKIRNLRDQVDMLLQESGPQRLFEREIAEYDINDIEGELKQTYLNNFLDALKRSFETGDITALNERQIQLRRVIDHSKTDEYVNTFIEKVQKSSLLKPETKKRFGPIILKQANSLDKFLDRLIADKDGKVSSEALTIFYGAGLGCIILSVIMARLIKPDFKDDISKIKNMFENKEWLELLKLVAKDLLKYGIIALPAIMGLVFILMAVLEQFTNYKLITAMALYIRSKFTAPLIILAKRFGYYNY